MGCHNDTQENGGAHNILVFFVFLECATLKKLKKHKFICVAAGFYGSFGGKRKRRKRGDTCGGTAGIGAGDVRFQLHHTTKNLLQLKRVEKC